jgi:hypothetical protein
VLELVRALRRDGFVTTHVTVGDVSIELAPVVTAPASSARGKADVRGVVDEYGGAALAKVLGETDDGSDDEWQTAVKA